MGGLSVTRLQAHCLSKPGAWADNPWEHDHPVVKVGPGSAGKIFAFLGADGAGVKGGATREVSDEWLQRFPDHASVMRYIGRSGWNDLAFGGIPEEGLLDAVDESSRLLVSKLPSKPRPEGWDVVPGSAG